mmetsp:Transcript_72004/g.223534  ORF Transcript_72004/g.223534 Transcript_72004/m.223534 type:complete len:310 (+) Transcript_72004:112-1041(+)
MRLSAEAHSLLEKRIKQALQPLEILLCGLLSTVQFVVVFVCCVFGVRYHSSSLATLIILLCLLGCAAITLNATLKYRTSRPSRPWIALALSLWVSLVCAYLMGNRYWYKNTVNYYNLKDMASYVNIDPATDKGQSYMDAGTVYFKEGSYVLRSKALAFRNGLTYCVAPILRAPLQYQPGSDAPETVSGFLLPRSGTVDFWAVGTDCCGRDGNTFSCGEAGSQLARSGLRLLDDTARSMYLLAVQEWSASTGLPVRHPVFFQWVKDPVLFTDKIYSEAWQDFWLHVVGCLIVSLLLGSTLHTVLLMFKVH